jgi:hypothetical protein
LPPPQIRSQAGAHWPSIALNANYPPSHPWQYLTTSQMPRSSFLVAEAQCFDRQAQTILRQREPTIPHGW